jgi:hypothetical protein
LLLLLLFLLLLVVNESSLASYCSIATGSLHIEERETIYVFYLPVSLDLFSALFTSLIKLQRLFRW